MHEVKLPFWLRIAWKVAVLAWMFVLLFFFAASCGLLPTFGSLTLKEGEESKTYRSYELSCRKKSSEYTIEFFDKGKQVDRKIQLRGGVFRGDGILAQPEVLLDNAFIKPEDCAERYVMMAKHGGGKSPKVNEYVVQLDCAVPSGRIQADLHGYSCLDE